MIEMICIVWMIMLRRQMIDVEMLKGINAIRVSQIGLALGFAVWISGTAIMYWPRKQVKSAPEQSEHRNWL